MSQPAVPTDLNSYGEPFAMTPAARGLGLRLLGVAALGAAIAGLVLPLWPTTPFAILAAWAFARSSPELEARVMPVSAEVSTGSWSLPSLTMKMFSPAPSAT